MDINEIISDGRPVVDIIADLKDKSIPVPAWSDLEKDYDPTKHEIMTNPALRPREKRKKNGQLDRPAKILYPAEKIVTRRMNQMCFTIPVERKYETGEDETLKAIAKAIESGWLLLLMLFPVQISIFLRRRTCKTLLTLAPISKDV